MSDEKRADDTDQSDVPQEIAIVEEHPVIMTVQDLIDRCVNQAEKFGKQSKTRLLLYNAARALAELATRLNYAEQQLNKSTLVVTDN